MGLELLHNCFILKMVIFIKFKKKKKKKLKQKSDYLFYFVQHIQLFKLGLSISVPISEWNNKMRLMFFSPLSLSKKNTFLYALLILTMQQTF